MAPCKDVMSEQRSSDSPMSHVGAWAVSSRQSLRICWSEPFVIFVFYVVTPIPGSVSAAESQIIHRRLVVQPIEFAVGEELIGPIHVALTQANEAEHAGDEGGHAIERW